MRICFRSISATVLLFLRKQRFTYPFKLDDSRSSVCIRLMKTKLFALICALSLPLFFTGCVRTADGHMKAGMPLTKDKIVSRYERSVPQILSAARVVLAHNGQIQVDDTAGNALHARVNDRHVWVAVSQVPEDPKISEVVVQSRAKVGGDVDLASEISKQIAIQLAVQ